MLKKLTIFLFSIFLLAFQAADKPVVFDQERLLTASEMNKLRSVINNHEIKTTNQIAIVTTLDMDGYADILEFATDFGNELGVGKADKDNGVVIAVSKNMRKVAIANGHGVTTVMPDKVANQIINEKMIPHFRIEEYYQGIYEGTKAVIAYLEKPENRIKTKHEN